MSLLTIIKISVSFFVSLTLTFALLNTVNKFSGWASIFFVQYLTSDLETTWVIAWNNVDVMGIICAIWKKFAYFFEISEFWKGIFALPAVGALFSILYKIWREDLAQEHQIRLQNRQQDFMLGTKKTLIHEVRSDENQLMGAYRDSNPSWRFHKP